MVLLLMLLMLLLLLPLLLLLLTLLLLMLMLLMLLMLLLLFCRCWRSMMAVSECPEVCAGAQHTRNVIACSSRRGRGRRHGRGHGQSHSRRRHSTRGATVLGPCARAVVRRMNGGLVSGHRIVLGRPHVVD